MSQTENPTTDQLERHDKKSWLGFFLRPKVAIPLILLLLLGLSPFISRGYFLMGVPDVEEGIDRDEIFSRSVPADENAFTHYEQAVAILIQPSDEVTRARERVDLVGWSGDSPELIQFLHDNEDALLEFRRGAELRRAQYIDPQAYDFAVLIPVSQELRELTRSARALSDQLEAEGRAREAWQWINAMLRAGQHSGTNGGFIERLVGIANSRSAIERLSTWAANPTLTADDLRAALADFNAALELAPKNSGVFDIEYLSTVQSIELMQSGAWQWKDMELDLISNPFVRYVVGEPELGLRLIRFTHRNARQFCDRPPFERPPVAGVFDLFDDPAGLSFDGQDWTIEEFDTAASRSMVFRMLTSQQQTVLDVMDRNQSELLAAKQVLAAQAFHRDHGRFPARLDELVPDYLPELPIDPFSGKAFLLSADPEGPVIYSVFQNRRDDGGTEFLFEQVSGRGKAHPDDLGVRLIPPGSRALAAPKPPIGERTYWRELLE